MSRRVGQDDGTHVSLLPFLAVLICTMGALIILLVVVVQQARVSARVASLAKTEPPADSNPEDVAAPKPDSPHQADPPVDPDLVEQRRRTRETLLWEIETLQQSRERTSARVQDRRLELSQVESHAQRLEAQLDTLHADAERLEQAAASEEVVAAADTQRLTDLHEEIDSLEQSLKDAKLRNQQQNRSFAVVPYVGPHGTARQPFYVECLGDRVVVQPEGIRLDIADLLPPLGPANPLAAALRQKREWLAARQNGRLDSEPYPLLIVRPDGSSTYQQARVALEGWGTEFGYELIEADRPLVYPSVDPGVIPSMQRAVAQARQRQALERTIAKSRERQRSKRDVLRASPRGGFVHYDGRPITVQDFVEGAKAGGVPTTGSSTRSAGPGSSSRIRTAAASPPPAATRSLSSPQLPTGELLHPRDLPADLESLAARRQTGSTDPRSSQFEFGDWNLPKGNESHLENVRRDANFQMNAHATTDGDTTDRATESVRRGPTASDLATGHSATSKSAMGKSAMGKSAMGKSAMGGSPPGSSATSGRGHHWAIPDAGPDAFAITRPIFGTCDAQRIVIMPEAGSRDRPIEIHFDGATASVIEPFAGVMRQKIGGWGIAGTGVYWKPVLRLSVAPNAERRFDELQSQLRNSGIEVVRR